MAAHGMMALRKPVIAVDEELKKRCPSARTTMGNAF